MILAIAACSTEAPPSVRVKAVPAHADSVVFVAPATAHLCSGGRALLLQAADDHGNGALLLLRHGDSLVTARLPLIALGDSITPRGANAAFRYMIGDVAHGLSLDSGTVDLTVSGGALTARAHGSGLDVGVRVAVDAAYGGVLLPAAADTVPCRFMP